jgi:hypothetical protein
MTKEVWKAVHHDGRNLDEYCEGGMRIKDDSLFSPKFQKEWKGIRLKLISETRFWQSQSIIKRLFFNEF